jgi:hypothetical protein
MADNSITGAVASGLTPLMIEYTFDSADTTGANGRSEITYQNPDWQEDYGIYCTIPEFKKAVDTKALWTIGAGFEADEPTKLLLSRVKGNGKDSFNSILKNMIKCKTISRDSFAEIIRDEDGVFSNLKPLNSGSMRIVQNKQGMIIRYEQVGDKIKKFKPEDIFHLSHDRIADEIKGTRVIESLKWLITARAEAMSDWKRVLHRNISPLIIWHLDTDNSTEIAAFKAKTDAATALGENMYIPKGTVVPEVLSTAQNATLNPTTWINQLGDYFFQAVNVPQIIIGQGKEFTDASGKIVYLAYEQSVKEEQLYVEEQVLGQLNIEIKLTFPASLQNELISSRDKDSDMAAAQPNDLTAEMEGNA